MRKLRNLADLPLSLEFRTMRQVSLKEISTMSQEVAAADKLLEPMQYVCSIIADWSQNALLVLFQLI